MSPTKLRAFTAIFASHIRHNYLTSKCALEAAWVSGSSYLYCTLLWILVAFNCIHLHILHLRACIETHNKIVNGTGALLVGREDEKAIATAREGGQGINRGFNTTHLQEYFQNREARLLLARTKI